MKRFIVNILVFFSIVAAIDFAVGKFGDYLQSHAKGGNARTLNDLVMNDCHDIIILGSSRAHHHYDTPFLSDALGIDVYNAGYDGNGAVLAYGLFELICEHCRPKLLLFDVEPAFDIYEYDKDNAHKRYISLLKPYYRNNTIGEIIKDVSIEEWYKVHSGLLRFNSNLIKLAADNLISRSSGPNGYEAMEGIYSREPEERNNQIQILDTFKLKYVDKILVLANTKDIPIIVVASPKYGATSSICFQPVKDLCRKHQVPFIDYYADSIFMSHKEWFKEPMHLNATGARVFSSLMVNEINYFFQN